MLEQLFYMAILDGNLSIALKIALHFNEKEKKKFTKEDLEEILILLES